MAACSTQAQQLEPRAYAALPKNLNSVLAAYSLSKGNVLSDPALPIQDLSIVTHSIVGSYVRTFGFVNKLARVQVTVPYTFISGSASINGRDTSAARSGLGDARLRLGINLTGSPPLDKKDFVSYTQETIIGVSLVTSIPTGLYYPDKRINLGNNRWGFKPEVGISKRFGRMYAESYAGVWFYTNNNCFLKTKTLDQKPVFNLQAHGSYFFKNKMMVSANVVWFTGGQTVVDGKEQGSLLNNWRAGATWSMVVARGQSIRLQFNLGAFTESGYDYNELTLSYLVLF